MAELQIRMATSKRGQAAIEALVRRADRLLDPVVLKRTARLLDRVRRRGDKALLKALRKYDGVSVKQVEELRFVPAVGSGGEGEDSALPTGFVAAFERAMAAIESYHQQQVHPGFELEVDGVELIERRLPLRRVGLYVPGGRAAYPSTVAMTAIPARLAGVQEIVVATPPQALAANPALRWALGRLGITEVWGMGGAQAVAALAYGTETIQRVDKIVGPGNAWVTAAKHLVSTTVAIDGLAGPSEVVIVASQGADPAWVAADLLAQAEHDPQAVAVLITEQRRFASQVDRQLRRQLRDLPTRKTARAALAAGGRAFVVANMAAAQALVERLAPEHLQLVGAAAETLAERVVAAGAVFVGATTPEVFGDYLAGPSHVLPTAGSARFASALGVEDFVRRGHQIHFTATAAAAAAEAAAVLADAEGLPAHARSARLRVAPEED